MDHPRDNAKHARSAPDFSPTREIASASIHCLHHIYRPQDTHKKAGILLHRLLKRSNSRAVPD